MPKIITPGARDRWPVGATLTCSECGCVWEIEAGDRFTVSHGDKREPGRAVSASCPSCERSTWGYEPHRNRPYNGPG